MIQKQFYQTALDRLRLKLQNGEDIHAVAIASESLLAEAAPHEPDIPDHLSKKLLAQIEA